MMPDYLLLLYRSDAEAGRPERRAERPLWAELNQSLREAGLLVSDACLHPVATATTVRALAGEVELTDGPFAVTKEVPAGFYLIRCADLDEAVEQADRLPLARYGSIEVRPVADPGPPPPDQVGAHPAGDDQPSGRDGSSGGAATAA
jgi:hypothetical protein